MKDAITTEEGKSRYLRTVAGIKQLCPTYDSFLELLAKGEFPIDLAGINPDGFAQLGTDLNKANMLTDATAALAGLGPEATPEQMFAALANSIKTLNQNLTALQNRVNKLIGSGTTALTDGAPMTNEIYVKY